MISIRRNRSEKLLSLKAKAKSRPSTSSPCRRTPTQSFYDLLFPMLMVEEMLMFPDPLFTSDQDSLSKFRRSLNFLPLKIEPRVMDWVGLGDER